MEWKSQRVANEPLEGTRLTRRERNLLNQVKAENVEAWVHVINALSESEAIEDRELAQGVRASFSRSAFLRKEFAKWGMTLHRE